MSAKKTIAVSVLMQAGNQVHADIRGHQVTIDQPVAAGGSDAGPTPLEFFLFSLGGCIASIARLAATQQKIALRSIAVDVTADLNPAGLLGKPSTDRVGFQQLNVTARIDADLTDAEKQVFLDAVCARCPLHDNIQLETAVAHHLER